MEKNFTYIKGRIIEYDKRDKQYWKFLFLKASAFLIDILLVIIMEVIMSLLFGGFFKEFAMISIIGIVYFVIYNMLFMFITNGQTLGMKISGIIVVHKSGFKTSKSILLVRGLLSGFYALPIIGWAMMVTSIISSLLFKGMSMVDLTSATAVVLVTTYIELNKIEKEYLEEELGENYE